MRHAQNIICAFLLLMTAACSSSIGAGTPAPGDTTVVVPPGSSATVTP